MKTSPSLEDIEAALDMHYLTEIIQVDKPREGLINTWSRGRSLPTTSSYSRPMFQIMGVTSAEYRNDPQVPCASCGDFSRSWNCPAHTYWAPADDTRSLPAPLEDAAFSNRPVMEQIRRAYRMDIPAMAPGRVVFGTVTSVDGRTIHIEAFNPEDGDDIFD